MKNDEKPIAKICFENAFRIARTEVTSAVAKDNIKGHT